MNFGNLFPLKGSPRYMVFQLRYHKCLNEGFGTDSLSYQRSNNNNNNNNNSFFCCKGDIYIKDIEVVERMKSPTLTH